MSYVEEQIIIVGGGIGGLATAIALRNISLANPVEPDE